MTVLGILFLCNIINVADWKKWAFTLVTFFGGIWIFVDLIWTLKSPSKRKKNCLLDKIILIPNGLALIGLDTFALIKLIKDPSWTNIGDVNFFQYLIGSAILYVALVFLFEAIYHWYHVHPLVYEMIEEDEKKEQEESVPEETKEE